MKDDWDHYVGDPCYVIDNDRWGEFCDKLWDELHGDGWPRYIEWTQDGKHFDLAIHTSPGGDGTWGFRRARHADGWRAGKEMAVDAGLLAVIPRELVSQEAGKAPFGGMLFKGEPELETGRWVDGEVVLTCPKGTEYIQDECAYCECGDVAYINQMWDTECCRSPACGSCYGSCDCFECDECKEWREGSDESHFHDESMCYTCADYKYDEEE